MCQLTLCDGFHDVIYIWELNFNFGVEVLKAAATRDLVFFFYHKILQCFCKKSICTIDWLAPISYYSLILCSYFLKFQFSFVVPALICDFIL